MRYTTAAARLRAKSQAQESFIARDMGGKVTIASGALSDPSQKGDVIARMFRVEAKFTEASSYSLKQSILAKIEDEALRNCQCPLLSLQIDGNDYAVLRWTDFLALIRDAKYV